MFSITNGNYDLQFIDNLKGTKALLAWDQNCTDDIINSAYYRHCKEVNI